MPVWDADKNAVKQELDEFRKDPARVKKFFDDALGAGYFKALEVYRANGVVKRAMFEHEYRRYFEMLQPHISEARKVIPHIRMALDRLELVCQQGRERRDIERVFAVPDHVNAEDAIHVLQGWLATFFAHYLKFFGFIHGSGVTEDLIRSWAADSWDILQKRKQEHSMVANHDELFQKRLMQL
jgi:hypothetical protein